MLKDLVEMLAVPLVFVLVAKQMINNGDLILRTEKLASMNRSLDHSVAMQLIYGERKEEE